MNILVDCGSKCNHGPMNILVDFGSKCNHGPMNILVDCGSKCNHGPMNILVDCGSKCNHGPMTIVIILLLYISGMTNRKDMIDEALIRPGRLEVQMEIGKYRWK